jgi:hypothetical protein
MSQMNAPGIQSVYSRRLKDIQYAIREHAILLGVILLTKTNVALIQIALLISLLNAGKLALLAKLIAENVQLPLCPCQSHQFFLFRQC